MGTQGAGVQPATPCTWARSVLRWPRGPVATWPIWRIAWPAGPDYTSSQGGETPPWILRCVLGPWLQVSHWGARAGPEKGKKGTDGSRKTCPVRSDWGNWGCLIWRKGGSGGPLLLSAIATSLQSLCCFPPERSLYWGGVLPLLTSLMWKDERKLP